MHIVGAHNQSKPDQKLIVLFLACTKGKSVNGDHYECTKKVIIMNGRNRRDRITREQREVLSSGHSMVPNQGVNGALVNIGWSSDPWPWPGPTLAALALQPSHYMTALREMTYGRPAHSTSVGFPVTAAWWGFRSDHSLFLRSKSDTCSLNRTARIENISLLWGNQYSLPR